MARAVRRNSKHTLQGPHWTALAGKLALGQVAYGVFHGTRVSNRLSSTPQAKMATYTEEQLARYFEHIGFRHEVNAARQHMSRFAMGILTVLQMRHMARVPFECLSLHYSRSRLLSLEPDDLFEKIVNDGKGGYCMEVNTFFAAVLRSVGFTLFSAGARVRGPEGYKGWCVHPV